MNENNMEVHGRGLTIGQLPSIEEPLGGSDRCEVEQNGKSRSFALSSLLDYIVKNPDRFKGYYTTPLSLNTANPQSKNIAGFYAYCGISLRTSTVWVVNTDGEAWINTGSPTPINTDVNLNDYAKVTDLNNKADLINSTGNKVIYGADGKISDLEINESLKEKIDLSVSLEKRLYGGGNIKTEVFTPRTEAVNTDTDFGSAGHYYYSNYDKTKGCYIEYIELLVSKAGTLTILAGKDVYSSNYAYRELKTVTLSTGVQKVRIDARLNNNEVLGFGLVGNTIQFKIRNSAPNPTAGNLQYLLNGSWGTLKYDLCIGIFGYTSSSDIVKGDIQSIFEKIDEVEKKTLHLLPEDHIEIYSTDFDNLDDFSMGGTWTDKTPTAQNTHLGLQKVYNVDNRIMRLELGMKSNSFVKIPCIYGGINAGHGASCFGIDLSSKKLIIYSAGNGSDDQDYSTGYTTTELKTVSIPTSMIGNRDYVIEVSKYINKSTLSLYDTLTGDAVLVEYDGWGAGLQNENYVIQQVSGGFITLKSMSISALNNPDIVIVGDSIAEGAFVIPHTQRYSDLLRKNYPDKKIVLSARSGATIDDVLGKFDSEYNRYLPKNMIITIGTNGGNTLAKLSLLKQNCEAINCKLYVNHITCNVHTGVQSHQSVNAMIESMKFKGCRFDVATALNNNPSEGINPALFAPDKGHPNVDGNLKMYNRFAIDLPELFFRKTNNSTIESPKGDLNDSFTKLESDLWDGSNKYLTLNSDRDIYVDTERSSGKLYVQKGWYDEYKLSINGKELSFNGNVVISYINSDNTLVFYKNNQVLFTSNTKASLTVKTFTGNSSEVISSTEDAFLTTKAFSLGVKAKISANGFIAIGRSTTTVRYWDFIFSNYQNNNRKEASMTVNGVTQAIAGSLELDKWYKFIATYNGTNSISVYVDGVLMSTVSTSQIKEGGTFNIGSILNLISRGSTVENVFFANKELSKAEVAESYSLNSPLNSSFATSVVKYWDFADEPAIKPSLPKAEFSQKAEPILTRGIGAWEDGDIANPDVVEDTLGKSGYKYIMNYSGYGTIPSDSSPKWRMCLAYSNDLENWVRDADNPIFSPNANEGYISCNGSIAIFNNLYYHFYQRGKSADIASSQICLATSPDLKMWTRQNGGNPVILPTAGGFDNLACFDPCVRLYDNIFYMLYCANGGLNAKIGLATSMDGITWSKKGAVVTQTGGASEPSFVRIDKNNWYISHDLYSGANREIFGAWWDGKSTVVTEKILARGQSEWKSASVFDSYPIYKDGKIYMFYAGGNVATPNEGLNANIGISVSQI